MAIIETLKGAKTEKKSLNSIYIDVDDDRSASVDEILREIYKRILMYNIVTKLFMRIRQRKIKYTFTG